MCHGIEIPEHKRFGFLNQYPRSIDCHISQVMIVGILLSKSNLFCNRSSFFKNSGQTLLEKADLEKCLLDSDDNI